MQHSWALKSDDMECHSES